MSYRRSYPKSMRPNSPRPQPRPNNAAATVKIPEVNTRWERICNQKRYFLRQVHAWDGKTFVWI